MVADSFVPPTTTFDVLATDPTDVARAYPLTDLVKLVRAYGVLAGTCDADRVMAGTISRRWIASEVERQVPLGEVPPAFFRTLRGRDLLAAEFWPDADIDPETIEPADLDIGTLGAGRTINSNRLPKLEPLIHRAVLAASMLLGVRLYGAHGQGVPGVTHDLIVASMLQDALGRANRFSGVIAGDHELVDDVYVRTWFGDGVAAHARTLHDALAAFDRTVDAGEPAPATEDRVLATAIAAVQASRLRLSARAAGDRVVSFLDAANRRELALAGVDCTDDFPERPWLERDHARTVAAFAQPGVDHRALREPLRHTLLAAVGDALADPDRRDSLSGPRGKATHEVHLNLPIMEYFVASEAPNSIETVHLASLEMMRSLDKGRRKSLSTMSAHAFRIASLAERVLGRALQPLIVTVAMLHDVVEDGSLRVTGYGHSLRKIQFRFGGPVAAMVSELTDSTVSSAGASKARLTLAQPYLLSPQVQFDVGRFTHMHPEPTEEHVPYTLAGIVIKLLDTVASFEEGIRDPELMLGHWRCSGARIYWAERVRGEIVQPLLERLVIELRASRDDPRYAARPHHVNAVRLRAGLALVETVLAWQDLYAVQNLAILAREYGLDDARRALLVAVFHDRNASERWFVERVLEGMLDDALLPGSIADGRLPCLGWTTLYPNGAEEGAPRDVETFLRYRRSALRRQAVRHELGLATPDKLAALELRRERVVRAFDLMTEREGRVRAALVDAARRIAEENGGTGGRHGLVAHAAGTSVDVPALAPASPDGTLLAATGR